MQIDINKIHQKYLTLKIPNRFTLTDIHERLTTKYQAQEVDISNFSGLRLDPHADWESVVTAYVIRDKNAIRELEELNKESELYDSDYNVIINSKDKIHITGSTLQGFSIVLMLEMDIFWGMDKEEMYLGNKRFEEYLIILYILGYIQFENDDAINYVRDRYKNGYYLRFFGNNDGRDLFLDNIIDVCY